MRGFITGFFRFVLRIFFRRIEISGIEDVPTDGPALFVLNHSNALIDPLIVLCLIPRPVSFLAKSTLFKMPFVSFLTRKFESIPVYRKGDEASDPSKNRETFDRARQHLARGGAIAIFPEGISHSDSKLRPLKTGAARIALSGRFNWPVKVVPVGIYYTAKSRFRSEALLRFGKPIDVWPPELRPEEPDPIEVRGLTGRIAEALQSVTLQSDEVQLLEIASKAVALFPSSQGSLTDSFLLQKRVLDSYRAVEGQQPEKLRELRGRVAKYTALLADLGIPSVGDIPEKPYSWSEIIRFVLLNVLRLVLLFPIALIGTIIHYPAYHVIDIIAVRIAKSDVDLLSTVKIITALLMYPLSWFLTSIIVDYLTGHAWGFLAGVTAPLFGFLTLFLGEQMKHVATTARVFVLQLHRRAFLQHLRQEGIELSAEISRLAPAAAPPS